MRDNLNIKIPVLNKMIGLGEEVVGDTLYKVPQNSTVNFKQKLGLCELQPLENSTNDLNETQRCRCPHCENMAKNFLYLESLIRSNYNAINNCSVCHSSLQYLQFINKSIMKVFGNFDSVVAAAKAFGHDTKPKPKVGKLRPRHLKKPTAAALKSNKVTVGSTKEPNATLKVGKKIQGSHYSVQGLGKKTTANLKKVNKKSKYKRKDAKNHCSLAASAIKIKSNPEKDQKFKVLKSKTKNLLQKIKLKKSI